MKESYNSPLTKSLRQQINFMDYNLDSSKKGCDDVDVEV